VATGEWQACQSLRVSLCGWLFTMATQAGWLSRCAATRDVGAVAAVRLDVACAETPAGEQPILDTSGLGIDGADWKKLRLRMITHDMGMLHVACKH
jgi:hypothetical protein